MRSPPSKVLSARCCWGRVCRRPVVLATAQKGADTSPDDRELLDWKQFFDTLSDSDDLGLPGFGVENVRKKKKQKPSMGNCYGCGVQLQTQSARAPGYVDKDTIDVKQRHKQRNSVLCSRCRALTHGEMVPAVRDFSQQQEMLLDQSAGPAASESASNVEDPDSTYTFKGELLMTPEQLREQLKVIRSSKAVCVMIIDVLDTSGSFLARVRNLIGGNPIIVVATKVDLLPKGTNYDRVHEWLDDFVAFKRLNCLSVHLVSNKTGEGLDEACASILSQRMGRDVFIIGAANVGKSAYVRRMLKEMANMTSRHFDAKATLIDKKLPVESAMPGTTLGFVKLGAFSSGGALYDTPGLHLHHRMLHILTPAELKAIHPKRKLRPYVAATPLDIAEQNADLTSVWNEHSEEGGTCTYLWGALLRIDVLESPADTHFVFFGTGQMQVYACRLFKEDEELLFDDAPENGTEAGAVGASEAFAARSVAARGGLRVAREVELRPVGYTTTLADVTMSGMPGWVSVVSGGMHGTIRLRAWAPKGVEVHMRPPMPCPTPVSIRV